MVPMHCTTANVGTSTSGQHKPLPSEEQLEHATINRPNRGHLVAGLITELRRPDGLPGTDRHGRFTSPSDVLL